MASSTKNIFSKHLPNVKLTTRFDAEGNEIQVERREDEEQKRREQEIIEALVGAGYYRAHIHGLSSFDKIIGGMTWCIDACDFDVDVDLLFHENLTIGQKIALTEKIVAVLPRMKCPYAIEPHQIQGLDFINILPVVRWLVKRSVENRSLKADKLRKLAAAQFQNYFQLEGDREAKRVHARQLAHLRAVEGKYLPKRQFRRLGARELNDVASESADPQLYEEEEDEEEEEEEITVEDLSSEKELEFVALFKSVAKEQHVPSGLSEVDSENLAKQFEGLSKSVEDIGERNRLKTLLATKLAFERKLEQARAQNDQLMAEVETEQSELEQMVDEKESLEEEIRNLDNLEISAEHQKILDYVKELVLKNERMKKQETQFKESCKKELAELQQQIEKAEAGTPEEDIEEQRKQLELEQERLKSLRLQLAKKNRAYVSVNRQLDNIPDRTELAQYQRRFLELYNQVSGKHRETKQFYTLYNTLDDTMLYLKKEMSLLNSIFDNYASAMQTPHSREQFIQQFESIVEGIRTTKAKLKKKCDDEKAKRDGLNSQLLCLVEQQRKYAGTVKQLTMECQRNEALMQHLKSLQAAAATAN